MTGEWTPEMQKLAESFVVEFNPTPEMFVCMDQTGGYHVSWTIEQHRQTMAKVSATHEQRYEKAAIPDRLKAFVEPKCWLHLGNGWTVSLGRDMDPAICSVGAWPSGKDKYSGETEWFHFASGGVSERCFSLDDIRKALLEVENAGPPPA